MLETYTTDDVIAETDAEIITLSQLLNQTLIEYAKLLWSKALRCNEVHDIYVVKSNLIEGIQDYVSRSEILFGVRTNMQQYKTWHDMTHLYPASRMVQRFKLRRTNT